MMCFHGHSVAARQRYGAASRSRMFYLSVLMTLACFTSSKGENIAFGKIASQARTYNSYTAARAVKAGPNYYGAHQGQSQDPAWWQVDLLGYYDIFNITVVSCWASNWYIFMRGAEVSVSEKNRELCPNVPKVICGHVNSSVGPKEYFVFTCNAPFPVRFVRLDRPTKLNVGHVNVQGQGTKQCLHSGFTRVQDRNVTSVLATRHAGSAIDCGRKCLDTKTCLHYSHNKMAASDNCLLTSDPQPDTASEPGWVLYRQNDC